jgi:hypothetical protein
MTLNVRMAGYSIVQSIAWRNLDIVYAAVFQLLFCTIAHPAVNQNQADFSGRKKRLVQKLFHDFDLKFT